MIESSTEPLDVGSAFQHAEHPATANDGSPVALAKAALRREVAQAKHRAGRAARNTRAAVARPKPTGSPDLDGDAATPSTEPPGPPENDNADDGPKRMTPIGDRDADGRLFLSAKRTLPTAQAFVAEHFIDAGKRTLHCHNETRWQREGNRYVVMKEPAIKATLQPWLHDAFTYQKNKNGDLEIVPFPANDSTITSAMHAVDSHVYLPKNQSSPFWIDPEPGAIDPKAVIPCKTYNFAIETGEHLPATPNLFNTSALDFDPDPKAPPPVKWLAFLAQVWPNDADQIACLQEWFGLLLTADTSYQKAMLLIGPRRSGKGTIVRVASKLIGEANRVGLTPSGFAGNFGLQNLIGKSLATFPDARFHGEGVTTIVERMLAIIGEDSLSIDRKHLTCVEATLATRFVVLANELPRFNDSSNALVGRFIILKMTESFYGRERKTLTDELYGELPGIFLWAVDGLRRLARRGRFVQPAAGEEAVSEMEDLASPVAAFVRQKCIVGPDERAYCNALYPLYRQWCFDNGQAAPPTAPLFSRNLKSAFPQLVTRQDSANSRYFDGISVRGYDQ